MPQKSVPYAIARTRVLEGRLITKERLTRLVESASVQDVMRILHEYGYGNNMQDMDAQVLVDRELLQAYDYIRSVTPNEYATGVLLLKGDCHNIKSILKAKFLERKAQPYLRDYGTINPEKLCECMQDNDLSLLPQNMREAAEANLLDIEVGHAQVQKIECTLDAACFADMHAYAKKSGEPVVVTFVNMYADLQNLLMLLRVRRAQSDESALQRALLPGGTVELDKFIDALESGESELLNFLGMTRYQRLLGAALESVLQGDSFGLIERLCDDALLFLLRDLRYSRDGLAPLLGYLLAKEREAQAVRLIVAAKMNNVPVALTQERLRELYA